MSTRTVHPHGRGDNDYRVAHQERMYGSPPRAWGQCDSAALIEHQAGSPPRAWGQCINSGIRPCTARFTPTGVGTIGVRNWLKRHSTVHPHGRGDNLNCVDEPSSSAGSPPRAWGQWRSCTDKTSRRTVHPHGRGDNQIVHVSLISTRWFTPTGVGTMTGAPRARTGRPVHPHGRGDN